MVHSTRTLEPFSEADIPAAVSLLFASFHDTEVRKLFTDTPGARQWWHDTMCNDLLQKQNQTYLKVMEKGKMIAFSKWDMSRFDENTSPYLPWHPDMNSEAWEQFLIYIMRERKRVMGSRRHYCERSLSLPLDLASLVTDIPADLDTLVIHPDHQGTGAASTLLRWGCRQADCDRVYVYTDAISDESRLFEKFDFLDYSSPVFDNWLVPMVRIPAVCTESEW